MRKGFTIVELLIVLVIIAVLASLTIVAYSGLTSKSSTASLQSDLTNNAKNLSYMQHRTGHFQQV